MTKTPYFQGCRTVFGRGPSHTHGRHAAVLTLTNLEWLKLAIDEGLSSAVPGVDNLRVSMICPQLFVNDLIQDRNSRPLFNYEDWARELVNESPAFMGLTGGEEFGAPVSEAHGECDAVTNAYELDFKLILGESYTRAVSLTSRGYVTFGGLTLTQSAKSRKTEQVGLHIHVALRDYSVSQLENLLASEIKDSANDDSDRDIRGLLCCMDHAKNLMLIYPYRFDCSDGSPAQEKTVNAALYYDFGNVLTLRRKRHACRDTYLAYFLDDAMVITKVDERGLVPFDEVAVSKSKTYVSILDTH